MWTIAAPARAASMADVAISRGDTGTAELLAGVGADPVTAQVIMMGRDMSTTNPGLAFRHPERSGFYRRRRVDVNSWKQAASGVMS